MSAEPKRYEIGNMVYVEAPDFDALEARHARVREAAEALAIRIDGMYLGQETRALLSALRAALETK